MKKLSFPNQLLFFVNSFVALALLLSYLAPFVNPKLTTAFSFLALSYPVLLFVNLLFALYWAIKLKIQVLLPVFSILVGWGQLGNFIQIGNRQSNRTVENSVKVMSYNVRLFDLYNWSNNKKTRNKMFDLIKKEDAAILCFQEFFNSSDNTYFNTLDTLLEFQKAKNKHLEYTKILHKGLNKFGIITLTKYPILNRGIVNLADTNNNICIFTDVLIKKDTIRVYNMHLASIKFRSKDYKFIEEVASKNTDEQIDGSLMILNRLQDAFRRRATQVNIIATHIEASPYKVIVCGDFNDSPNSYAYKVMSCNLKDSFKERGSGVGATYNGKFPAYRIDYILVDKSFEVLRFKTEKAKLSDHFPLIGEYEI